MLVFFFVGIRHAVSIFLCINNCFPLAKLACKQGGFLRNDVLLYFFIRHPMFVNCHQKTEKELLFAKNKREGRDKD